MMNTLRGTVSITKRVSE